MAVKSAADVEWDEHLYWSATALFTLIGLKYILSAIIPDSVVEVHRANNSVPW